MKTDELNDTTKDYLLSLKHQVQIRLPKQTAEECIVVFPDIHSSNIADRIIDVDIYDETFAYLVDTVERIIQVLDYEAAPITEVCAESEKKKKWKKLKIVLKEATRIYIQGHE